MPRVAGLRPRVASILLRLAAATLLWVVVMAGTASAHPILVGSEPADGQVLSSAPARLRLEFTEPVLLSSVRLSLHPSAGTVRSLTPSAEAAGRVVASLPPLAEDIYAVRWAATSSEDGHRLGGSLVFGVRRAVTAAGQAVREGPRPWDSVLAAIRTVGLSTAVGGFLTAALLVPLARRRHPVGPWARVTRHALRAGSAGTGAALAAVTVVAAQSVWLIIDTAHGRRMIEQLVLLLAAFFLARRATMRDDRPAALGAVCAGLAVVVGALDGHAAAAGEALPAAVHALGAAVWIGGVIALAVAGLPMLADRAQRAAVRALLRGFAWPAAAAVVALGVTGPLLAGGQIATPYAGLVTPYGLILAIKLVFLLGVAAVAIRVARGRTGGRLLVVEAVLLAEVACCAAVLTVTPPARGPGLDPVPAAAPLQRSVRLDDLVLAVSVRPGTPGRNLVTVDVYDTRRPAPGRLSAVRLGVGNAPLAAVAVAERRWEAVADLPPAGQVPVQVGVQRDGLPDAGVRLDWAVRGDAPRGFLAERSLASVTGVMAWTIAALGAVAAAVALLSSVRRRREEGSVPKRREDGSVRVGREDGSVRVGREDGSVRRKRRHDDPSPRPDIAGEPDDRAHVSRERAGA
ncbi:copper resistance protein CopC [Sphaerisporangium album]|uniref:copper resistance CopC/CopD family protein n=1 Tax=Sphaerisporangium album TaxID=509200 RepID=UPI0015F012D7|nr:copper resistance protein CopC [Sphaerisporangium album]